MVYLKALLIIILVWCTLSSSFTQLRNLGEVDQQDKVEDCMKTDKNGDCEKCCFRKVLVKGKCSSISNQCKNWDNKSGTCYKCYDGFELHQNQCRVVKKQQEQKKTITQPISSADPLCKNFDSHGKCNQCYFRVVLNSGKCVAVSDLCRDWNKKTGECTECYDGYGLNQGQCQISKQKKQYKQDKNAPQAIQLCKSQNAHGKCTECVDRAVFINDKCIQVNSQCKTWKENGDCTDCYEGYELKQRDCRLSEWEPKQIPSTNQNNDLCNKLDSKGKCIRCIQRAVLIDCKCVVVSDLCKKWDKLGKCTQCYEGYQLQKGLCKICSQAIKQHPSALPAYQQNRIPLCVKQDGKGFCQQCAYRAVLIKGKCQQVNKLCKSWHKKTGECTDCFDGYKLEKGVCCISTETSPVSPKPPVDYLCKEWNNKGVCCGCVHRAVLIKQKCVAVSNDCKQWDNKNGKCTACYDGYGLQGGSCIIELKPKKVQNNKVQCKHKDTQQAKNCKKCQNKSKN